MTSRRRSPQFTAGRFAGALIFVVGFVMATLAPPLAGFDETAHILRSYEVSEGRLIPHRNEPRAGVVSSSDAGFGSFPRQLNADLQRTAVDLLLPGRDRTAFVDHLGDPAPDGAREPTRIGAIAGYSPVPYIPAAVGIRTGRVFDASTLQLVYLARYANLLAYVVLIVLAIGRCRNAQWLIAAGALLPVGLFGATTVTADGITYGLCILVVAMTIRLHSDRDRWRRPDTVLVSIALVALGFAKPPYALVGIVLAIAALGTAGLRRIALWSSVGVSWVSMFAWGQIMERPLSAQDVSFGTITTNDPFHAYTNVDAAKQLKEHVVGDPLGFLGVLWRTVRDFGAGWFRDAVVQLKIANVTPNAVAIVAWLMLLLAAFSARGAVGNRRMRVAVGATACVVAGATLLGAYMSWNAQGSPIIAAYQGRYLLIVVPLLALATTRTREMRSSKQLGAFATSGMALACIGYIVSMLGAFY